MGRKASPFVMITVPVLAGESTVLGLIAANKGITPGAYIARVLSENLKQFKTPEMVLCEVDSCPRLAVKNSGLCEAHKDWPHTHNLPFKGDSLTNDIDPLHTPSETSGTVPTETSTTSSGKKKK